MVPEHWDNQTNTSNNISPAGLWQTREESIPTTSILVHVLMQARANELKREFYLAVNIENSYICSSLHFLTFLQSCTQLIVHTVFYHSYNRSVVEYSSERVEEFRFTAMMTKWLMPRSVWIDWFYFMHHTFTPATVTPQRLSRLWFAMRSSGLAYCCKRVHLV